jgi:hypothetical protein
VAHPSSPCVESSPDDHDLGAFEAEARALCERAGLRLERREAADVDGRRAWVVVEGAAC